MLYICGPCSISDRPPVCDYSSTVVGRPARQPDDKCDSDTRRWPDPEKIGPTTGLTTPAFLPWMICNSGPPIFLGPYQKLTAIISGLCVLVFLTQSVRA